MSIASELGRLQQAKADLETSIKAKGVNVPVGTLLDAYPALVDTISGSSVLTGDAAVGDVLANKTFYADDPNNKLTGTMVDRGTVSTDISAVATEVTIAAGKHSGAGVVKIAAAEQAKLIAGNIKSGVTVLGVAGNVTSGTDTSDANATADSLLYGHTAYGAAGTKLTGTGALWQYAATLAGVFTGASYNAPIVIYAPNAVSLGSFASAANFTEIDVTFGTLSGGGTSGFYRAFRHNSSLTKVTLHGVTSSMSGSGDAFTNDTALITVDGDSINCTSLTADPINLFSGCSALENCLFAASTIKMNATFASSPLLSTSSLLSIANGLDAAAVGKTLTMHATSKTNMNSIMVDNNAGTAVDGTTMTLMAFITDIKVWTVA